MRRLRKPVTSLWLALLVLLVGVTPACSRLKSLTGPQDKGGTFLVVAVKPADRTQLDQSIVQTIAVIQNRCDQLGIYCKLERQGTDQIKLRFSSSMETGRVKSVLLAEGLELRAVVTEPSPQPVRKYPTRAEAETAAGMDNDVMPYQERAEGAGGNSESFIILKRPPIVSGQDIRNAQAVDSRTGLADKYQITFTLKPEGAARFGDWTGANINNYIAIVLNKKVRSVAYIKSQITDSAEITGDYTKEQAEDIARILRSGNLPAPVEVLQEGTYKP